MTSEEFSSLIANLTTAWVIWVSSISSLVTIEFWKQRRSMNAAFAKIRHIQQELGIEEIPWESKTQKKSSPSRK